IILLAEISMMSVYAFPVAARFDMGIKQILKTSFFMANRHLLTSISCLVLFVAAVLSFMVAPPLAIFLAPGLYGLLAAYMIIRVFKRYRPEMDKDPVLEIQEIEAAKAEERRRRDIGFIGGGGEFQEGEGVDFWTSVERENNQIPEASSASIPEKIITEEEPVKKEPQVEIQEKIKEEIQEETPEPIKPEEPAVTEPIKAEPEKQEEAATPEEAEDTEEGEEEDPESNEPKKPWYADMKDNEPEKAETVDAFWSSVHKSRNPGRK
ncbi:MAG: hypothetical protein FWE42_02725, partial [Defluviitaleaceae bacterium]|nr:hypothetical protein [Defluviitaleaceae bacterium]